MAYQWEATGDVLGMKHAQRRDSVTLRWLSEAVNETGGSASVLDVGCSYGNHLFMLNAKLGKPTTLELVGVDLFAASIRRANVFARAVPGFGNCRFEVADVTAGLPFEAASFNAINVADVLEHLADPRTALAELGRVAAPGATLVVSTPLRDSLFKRVAAQANRLSRGRLYLAYYRGKGAALNERGIPIMETFAGLDHVSEMTLRELTALCADTGFVVEDVEVMAVMSGSRWFDQHSALLAGLLLLEALHEKLRRPSWAHSVVVRLRKV